MLSRLISYYFSSPASNPDNCSFSCPSLVSSICSGILGRILIWFLMGTIPNKVKETRLRDSLAHGQADQLPLSAVVRGAAALEC